MSALKNMAGAYFGNSHDDDKQRIKNQYLHQNNLERIEDAVVPSFLIPARVPQAQRRAKAEADIKALDKLPCNCPTSKLFPHRRGKCAFGTVGSGAKRKRAKKRPYQVKGSKAARLHMAKLRKLIKH